MDAKRKISSNVKALMAEKKVTVAGLMSMTGLSNETVMRSRDHRIESCSLRTLAVIAHALGTGVKDLFEE
jgi:DNA-binding Xre family transcriptional regulator